MQQAFSTQHSAFSIQQSISNLQSASESAISISG
jgi:hypothetical protein